MTPPLVIPPYLKQAPLTGLIGMGGGATSRRFYTASSGDETYNIEKSIRFNPADGAYLDKQVTVSGNRRTWTISFWIKISEITAEYPTVFSSASTSNTNDHMIVRIEHPDGQLKVDERTGSSSSYSLETSAYHRDVGAWYHFLVAFDSTQATESERVKVFANGERQTLSGSYPSQNYESHWNESSTYTNNHVIGREAARSDYEVSGYLADAHFVDGLALSPAAFGSIDSNTLAYNPKAFTLPNPNVGNSATATQSGTGGTVGLAFDGIINVNNRWMPDASADQWIQANWATAINVTTSLRIYAYAPRSSSILSYYTVNGGTETEFYAGGASADWVTIPGFVGELSTLRIRTTRTGGSTTSPELWAVEVDGVILVNGQTDPSLTENNPHNGTVWSSFCTSSSGATSPGSFQDLFSGSGGANTGEDSFKCKPDTDGHTCTFIPPATINGTKIEIRAYAEGSVSATNLLEVNGTSYFADVQSAGGDANAAFVWVNVGTSIDSVNGVKWGRQDANDEVCISAIRVDGHILRDACESSGAGRNGFHLKFNDETTSTNLGLSSFEHTGTIKKIDGTYNTDSSAGTTDGTGLVLAIAGDSKADIHHLVNTGSSVKTVTDIGSPTVTTQDAAYGGKSIDFDGYDDGLTITEADDFDFGSGDFTIELWFRARTITPQHIPIITKGSATANNSYDWRLYAGNSANDPIYFDNGQVDFSTDTGGAGNYISANTWYHCAVVRNSTAWTIYVNGQVWGTPGSGSGTLPDSHSTLVIGKANLGGAGQVYFDGEMQDIRLYKGVAKYTEAFSPPKRNDFAVTNIDADSGFPHDGTVFSDAVTVDTGGFQSGYEPAKGFNGDLGGGNRCEGDTTDGVVTVPLVGTIEKDGVEINAAVTSSQPVICKLYNGSTLLQTLSSGASGQQWHTFSGEWDGGSPATVTKITIQRTSRNAEFNGVKINGVILIDGTGGIENKDVFNESPTSYEPDGGDTGVGGELRGNFCTWNPLMTSATQTFSEGNLEWKNDGVDAWTAGTLGVTYGSSTTNKWYFEVEIKHGLGGIGICNHDNKNNDYSDWGGGTDRARFYLSNNGKLANPAGGSDLTYGSNTVSVVGDIIGVAFDLSPGGSNGTITFYRNGSTLGQAHTDLDTTRYWTPFISDYGVNPVGGVLNTGQRAFAYTAPTDHKCLCTQNLADIFGASDNALGDKNKPSKYFDAKAYTGTGADQDIGMNFQPDFLWLKNRSDASTNHCLMDAINGNGSGLHETDAQLQTGWDGVITQSFNTDGFTASSHSYSGADGKNYVAWAWDAGTSANSSANTNGTDITVAIGNQWVNDTCGFSITKWTGSGSGAANSDSGDSVGHGLSAAPDYIMIKKLTSTNGWPIWHSSLNALEVLAMQSSAAVDTSNYCYPSAPTATAVPLGNNPEINDNADDFIMYAWREVKGYSAFGQYTGNAATAGPFCYCGFKPKYVLLKGQSFAGNWNVFDDARNPVMPANGRLFPNSSGAQVDDTGSGNRVNMMSNGFEIAGSNADTNNSGSTFIWCAFAEFPFKVSRGG